MFTRPLFVIAIATLGFIGAASAQPKPFQNNLGALFAYPPSTNVVETPTTAPIPGCPTVIQVIDLEGFYPEDSKRSSQAAVNASCAWEVAKQTKTVADARTARYLQSISDADYLAAKLIVASEKLAPKIEAVLFKGPFSSELNEETQAWVAMFEKFRNAVAQADATRIEIAEDRHFQQQEAQEIAASNRQFLQAFAEGKEDVYRLRQILR